MTTSATKGAKPDHENRGSLALQGAVRLRALCADSADRKGSWTQWACPPKRPGPNIDRLPDHWQTCMCKAPRGNDKC